jgi:hypothetical protein
MSNHQREKSGMLFLNNRLTSGLYITDEISISMVGMENKTLKEKMKLLPWNKIFQSKR